MTYSTISSKIREHKHTPKTGFSVITTVELYDETGLDSARTRGLSARLQVPYLVRRAYFLPVSSPYMFVRRLFRDAVAHPPAVCHVKQPPLGRLKGGL